MYMVDSDQRPNSNRRPLLKSAFTDVIISNHCPDLRGILKSASEIHRYMSDYWLGLLNTSVTSLDVDLTK
jgi:hypothetical protein